MSMQSLILIGGPTASGKSALALRLAKERNGNIINADAMQLYAGLPVLTAQPDAEDRAEIPHLLYEVTDAAEASSAGKWLVQARDAIEQTKAEGRTPIIVGGTGLYFDALMGGLADIPPIPDDARAKAAQLYNEWGEKKFRDELAKRDPESAARIARNDRQRLIRTYEVALHTGKSLGEWHKISQTPDQAYNAEFHLLLPPRDELYAACDKRFLKMIERGAIEEVKNFLKRSLPPTLPAMKILGVREIAAYLHGEKNLEESIAKAQQVTRNYAKRQMTWFRNKWGHQSLFGKETINENPF
ncbi:MAG: tRNA (adenosine(37)-N6)-dimethylallyltransferase MiaA [Bdellovibrionales bacterium]